MDIKKIKIGNTSYDVKDSVARSHLLYNKPSTSISNGEVYLEPNTYHVIGNPSTGIGEVEIVLPDVSDMQAFDSANNSYIVVHFKTNSNPSITFSADCNIKYFKGFSIEPDTEYEINCMFDVYRSTWIIAYGIIE